MSSTPQSVAAYLQTRIDHIKQADADDDARNDLIIALLYELADGTGQLVGTAEDLESAFESFIEDLRESAIATHRAQCPDCQARAHTQLN